MKFILPVLLVLLFAGPAYPVDKELLQLMRDVFDLQGQVKQLQSSLDQNNAAMKGLMEKMSDQVNNLSAGMQKINQAVDSVKQQNDTTNRDVRAALTGVNSTLKDVQEGMASLQTQMGSVSRAITAMKTTAEPLAGASDLWKNAMLDQTVGNWDLAIGGFQEFLSKYPNDPHAAEANLRMGDAYAAQRKFDQANNQYDIVLQKYPESDTTRAALLKKGLAQAESKQPQAKDTLADVIKRFPKTSEAATAEAKLKELQPPARPKAPGR